MRSIATRSLFVGIVVLVGAVLTTPRSAHADIIDLSSAGCTGIVCAPMLYPGGAVTLTAEGGTFATKTRHGATGLGLDGQTGGEIDPNEVITASFSVPVALNAFTILFLYNGPEFGDLYETAQISINGGSIIGTLSATEENNAVWSLGGASITSCGDTSLAGAGCFRIANPFGSALISDIAFTASSAGSSISRDSDFSLGDIEVAATPEPGTLLLLATGSAVVLARRKRRSSQTDLS